MMLYRGFFRNGDSNIFPASDAQVSIPGIPEKLLAQFIEHETQNGKTIVLDTLHRNSQTLLASGMYPPSNRESPKITQRWQLALLHDPNKFIKNENCDLTTIDNLGRNPIHYLCIIGAMETLRSLYAKNLTSDENFMRCDNFKNNILHFSALSRSTQMMRWVWKNFKKYPDFINNLNLAGMHFLHLAARSGSPESIEWALNNIVLDYKSLRDSYQRNFLQLAILSGSIRAAKWVFKYCEKNNYDLKNCLDHHGRHILHLAAFTGSVEVIELTLKNFPALKTKTDDANRNFLHSIASSGSVPALKWMFEAFPDQLEKTDIDRRNILHFAGISGSVPAIQFILTHLPSLKESVDTYEGFSLVDFVIFSGAETAIEWLLENEFDFAARYWPHSETVETPLHDLILIRLIKQKLTRLDEKHTEISERERMIEFLKAFAKQTFDHLVPDYAGCDGCLTDKETAKYSEMVGHVGSVQSSKNAKDKGKEPENDGPPEIAKRM